MSNRVYKLVLKKAAFRKLHDTTVVEHSEKFLDRLLTEGRVKRGWHGFVEEPVVEEARVSDETTNEDGSKVTVEKDGLLYKLNFYVVCQSKRGRLDEIVEKEVGEIAKVLTRTSRAKGWEIDSVDGLDFVKMPEDFDFPGELPEPEVRTKKPKKGEEAEPQVEVNLDEVVAPSESTLEAVSEAPVAPVVTENAEVSASV